MRNSHLVLLLGICCICFASCQKGISDRYNPADSTGHTDTSGNASDTASWNYLPQTAGSSWTYLDSASGKTYVSTMTDSMVTLNSIPFKFVKDATGDSAVYELLAITGNDYYQHISETLDSLSINFTLKYFNTAANTGDSWKASTTLGSLPATITTTLLEKNVTKTVQGQSYANVSHTHTEVSVGASPISFNAVELDYYVAKDIGIVQRQIKVNGGALLPDINMSATVWLTGYSIK